MRISPLPGPIALNGLLAFAALVTLTSPGAGWTEEAPAAGPAPEATEAAPATQAAPQPAAPALTPREQQLLDQIRRLKTPQLRSFGVCRYDWTTWRLVDGGARTTTVECGDPPVKGNVAVHCTSLKLTRSVGGGPWDGWRLPLSIEESKTTGGEDLMMAALCANVKPAGESGATPATPPPPAPKPAATKTTPAPAKPAKPPAPPAAGTK
jgi:hypothetical protein